MQFQITKTSKYAECLLQSASLFTVHSIYRKTINLSSGENLLSLQASGTVLSPLSLITDLSESQFSNLPYKVGDRVFIEIDKCVCEIKDLEFHNFPQVFSATTLSSAVKKAINESATKGFSHLFTVSLDVSSSPILLAAQKRISSSTAALATGDISTAAEELCRLIGLGIGLTPSGDDFLCGVLAAFHLLGLQRHPFASALKEQIRLHLNDTGYISRNFLICAMAGQFSEPVIQLSNPASYETIAMNFSKIGHSSGIDTLCGIYYICTLFSTF